MYTWLNFGSSGMLSAMSDGVVREITWARTVFVCGGLVLFALLAAFTSPSLPSGWLLGPTESEILLTENSEIKWNSWSTRADEWMTNKAIQESDPNWAGRQRLQSQRINDSLWWDKKATEYFIDKLESSQFPPDCSQAHWIAHFDYVAGLLSSVHMFLLPLFFGMVRGITVVPIAETGHHPAFDGCGPDVTMHNMQCYFNVTSCNPQKDETRWTKIHAQPHDRLRTSWEQALMEDLDFFPPAGVTVVQSWKQSWEDKVCVGSSNFESSLEAYNYYKFRLWDDMGRHGNVGSVKGPHTNGVPSNKCYGYGKDNKKRRLDMVMTSLMSSWMLNRVPEAVRLVADDIMSRYSDESGRPLWQPPVLAIHIRQTDKSSEDPYYITHQAFRPVEDYAVEMNKMEVEHGFEWPSIFILSDSGTAMETLMAVINGNRSLDSAENSTSTDISRGKERYIMYDWTTDDHLQERYRKHTKVPAFLKHDMQVHFLATLYILQHIADHAIVTYSSNVGRFIGETMAAKHRLAFADVRGPLVTSLDLPWFWN